MPYWCDACGRECSTYTGDPRMCLGCGGMAEWRQEEGDELTVEQQSALEMMDEEGVEKIRSRAGEWIGRDDIRTSLGAALEAMTIIEGVRRLDKPGDNRYESHPYCPDEDGNCIYGHPICPNKALRTAKEDGDDA